MIGMLDRGIDPRDRMTLNYTLRWLSGAWRNKVKNETIQNCYIKSTVLPGRRLSDQDQINQDQINHDQINHDQTNQDIALGPELRSLYHQVAEKLRGGRK